VFWHVIDGVRREVLNKLLYQMPVQDAYLAGGTALALQLGHRESIDFDWFTALPFEVAQVESRLQTMGTLEVTDAKRNTFHGILDGVQVTFLRYPYPLIHPFVVSEDGSNLRMASLLDIGTMKMIAVSQRGARKDFIDLYALHRAGVTLNMLTQRLPEKFHGNKVNLYHIVKSLTYFDDAEEEPIPRMLTDFNWDEVKSFFQQNQHELVQQLKHGD